jgi:endonuclease/exonuclease/phosphatase family metal-dependent hydrolase
MSWLFFATAFVEEPQSLIRAVFWQTPQKTSHTLRVITLNCAGGSLAAAAEVKRFQPDIVLWQEIPDSTNVVQLAKQIFGAHADVAMGLDTAIAARGSVEQIQAPQNMQRYFAQGRVHLSQEVTIEVVSLHLMTPPFRLDLWSPDCWSAQRNQRQVQREQMASILKQLAKTPSTVPMIIGGDFNMPQGDAVLRLLQPRFCDSFRASGRGWGDTITNQYPVLRIDQIWMSSQFEAIDVHTHGTKYSDHRMVVCDFVLK